MRTVSKSIVSLDVGGTLIQPWPSVGHVYAEVGERFGLKREPDELTSGFMQDGRRDLVSIIRSMNGSPWSRGLLV